MYLIGDAWMRTWGKAHNSDPVPNVLVIMKLGGPTTSSGNYSQKIFTCHAIIHTIINMQRPRFTHYA